ncbi:HWE histidine kinase domain-containing protein [Devosia sp.]|uniref:HWE histidine kinase domain-containing protein n=1 Tax=Devosia sp. TaxID=1871048 RepID=UPI003A8D8B59
MSDVQTVDLTNCDREPIHIPGSIQPHGALLAFDASFEQALRHSENANELLGIEGEINGASAQTLLGRDLVHDLRNALAGSGGEASRPALLFSQKLPSGRLFDIAVHLHKGSVIVEFEPADSNDRPLQLARSLIGRISRIHSLEPLLKHTARLIRGALGYDRVMVYQFEADGAGKVVSEVKRHDLESFYGQYFPATDIPQQARALYLRNTIRIISSSDYRAIPLVPQLDLSGEPLDLSHAHLRSVSPIHLEYLRNMGVGASMSISIIVDGELWGLVACHHYSPKTLPMGLRVAAEMFGQFLSLHLSALRQTQKLNTSQRVRAYLDRVLTMASQLTIGELLHDNLADLGLLLPNDGFGIYVDGEWTGHGSTPDAGDIAELANFVSTVADGRIWATHKLTSQMPEAERYHERVSGLMAVPLSQTPRDYLFYFRKEMVQTLEWAGNPDKSYTTGPLGDRLTPRKSFAIWKETVRRQAQPWTEGDREIAEATRASLIEVVLRHNEAMAEEQAKAEVRQRMLNEELNHRVKNILAVIKSLVGQPVADGDTIEQFVDTLRGRIQSLSLAHDQVIRGEGGGALLDLLAAELSPYRNENNLLTMEGPRVWLDSRAFSVMALVSHELATNAAKYGAMSTPGGSLTIRWDILATGDVVIDWTERGGPPVTIPSRSGFGTALLDRSVPYDLGGKSEVRYEPGGLVARFQIPARHARLQAKSKEQAEHVTTPPQASTPTSELPPQTRILLLEDQMLIALDAESMLNDQGFLAVTTCSSVEEALEALSVNALQIAILDINLGVDTSIPVAEALRERKVPFVFATGYGEGDVLPSHLTDVPVVKKPYAIGELVGALRQVWGDREL